MTETSQEKFTFRFKTHEIHELKQAISALCDPQLNPKGVARIDFNDEKGLALTVLNVESRAHGSVTLLPVKSICNEYFIPRMVDLKRVFRYLMLVDDDDDDEDGLVIGHVVDSNELCFAYGDNPTKGFCVELLDLNAEVRELPVITLLYGVDILSECLRGIIPFMSDSDGKKLQNVSVTMIEDSVSISIGEKQWDLLQKVDETKARKKWEIDEELSWCFQWPHSELLLYSSYLSKQFSLACLDDLPDSILFRFPITETLALSFMKHHGTFAERTSSEYLKYKPNQIYSFSFHVRPITPLKKALRFLSNRTLCKPSGLGMIQVNDCRCQIIVRNADTGAFGLVQLLATGVINYRFKKDLKGNMVDVRKMARNLSRSADTDFVGVGQADGSNEISFKTALAGAFSVEVREMDGDFQEWPYNISIAYETRIPSKYVKEMVPLMMRNNTPQPGWVVSGVTFELTVARLSQFCQSDILFPIEIVYYCCIGKSPDCVLLQHAPVTLKIQYGFVSLSINGKSWDCEYNEQLLEQKHELLFYWPHPEILEQASDLADWFSICFLTHPPRSIMLRIKLENIGYLAYINKVHLTIAPSEGQDIPN